MAEPLLRKIRNTSPETLEDLILIMAKNVEASLVESGAEPGKDYTIRDLFNWGTPFALEVFKKNSDKITFAIEF